MIQPDQNEITLEEIFSCNDLSLLKKEESLDQLALHINHLILTNFESLIQLLYRLDVSEMKIKALLKENPSEDAGKIIAHLIIERQIQKIKFKAEQTIVENDPTTEGEERW